MTHKEIRPGPAKSGWGMKWRQKYQTELFCWPSDAGAPSLRTHGNLVPQPARRAG